MARAIDADILLQNFDDMEPYEEYESEHDLWLDMRMEVIHTPTLTPPNEWVSVEDEIPSDDDDGLEFFCMTNATGKGGGVLPLGWEVATIRGKTVRRWRWLNRISPWTVTHWMKRPAPPEKENSHE